MIPKILNVDDSKTIRLSLARLFARFDCEWREAANGAEGLAAALQEVPDLILSDWNMPVMDGITMVRSMRENPLLRRTPIIMLTTEARPDYIATAARLGVRDYLIKPFQEPELLAKVGPDYSVDFTGRNMNLNQANRVMNEEIPNPQPVSTPPPSGDPAAALAASPLLQAAVLVVDDSRTMRLGLIRALNTIGFRNITEAANGKQALELVLTKPFDLMLLDMEMPEMNGMEVLAALKANPDLSGLPVIVISGAEQMESAVKCIELGAEDFLPKPFNPTLLRARVTSSLEKKRLRDAVKEQIASELRVASEIQMGMLPHDFAPFEKNYGVEFGALLEPAREVGGDLYGVCAAGPERLVVFLGDVSGKGLPASMFMVRAISLARLLAKEIAEPEKILARLNDELAADNPSGMFVTFLCAVFEPKSGRLVMANGGHCRPVILHDGQPPRWAVKNLGTALGFEPGLEFERTELTLRDQDTLLLYTDGVSEAFNPQDECYGDARLLADAGTFAGQAATAITTGLLQKVRAFVNGAPQSDDIAIMTLKVKATGGQA